MQLRSGCYSTSPFDLVILKSWEVVEFQDVERRPRELHVLELEIRTCLKIPILPSDGKYLIILVSCCIDESGGFTRFALLVISRFARPLG